jgi:carbonic anhydrase
MIEVVYRFDVGSPSGQRLPATAAAAVARLDQGNRRFASLVAEGRAGAAPRRVTFPLDLSAGRGPGGVPAQRPFGMVVGCADARVPVEMLFGRAVNDLFVVRVAGNVIGSESLGSLDYAAHHFGDTVRVLVVLGHGGCGAVSAAVDAYLTPGLYLDLAASYPLRSVVDRLLVAVRGAARALEATHGRGVVDRPGYREALLGVAVVVNAAYAAYSLHKELHSGLGAGIAVVYGIYDLVTRRVLAPGSGPRGGLAAPPDNLAEFREHIAAVASTRRVREILARGNPAARARTVRGTARR